MPGHSSASAGLYSTARAAEFPRILAHELFHFVWLRLGNGMRRSFEDVLRAEILRVARGELGWSSEWRKLKLESRDWEARTPRWRDYCCESFCDTAAWMYSGVRSHPEYTLGKAIANAAARGSART